MHSTEQTFAELEQAQLMKVQSLENELGAVLVALKPDAPPSLEMLRHFAALDPDRLTKVQALEEELGIMLLAYRAD